MLGGRENPCWTSCCEPMPRGTAPWRTQPAPEAAGSHPARPQGAGDNGPSASLRDDSDNGSCPAMPMRGGAGKRSGASARRHS